MPAQGCRSQPLLETLVCRLYVDGARGILESYDNVRAVLGSRVADGPLWMRLCAVKAFALLVWGRRNAKATKRQPTVWASEVASAARSDMTVVRTDVRARTV